jgi:hypothetical protein
MLNAGLSGFAPLHQFFFLLEYVEVKVLLA